LRRKKHKRKPYRSKEIEKEGLLFKHIGKHSIEKRGFELETKEKDWVKPRRRSL